MIRRTQNPLVAWQIRTGIRHHNSRLFILNARDIKLERKATQFVKVAEGQEVAAIRWMGSEQGQLEPGLVEKLVQLKAALDAEPEVAIVFGAEVSGAAIAELVAFGSKLQGKVRYMALGDYANSRGAADMGVLPDRLPGYAYVDNSSAREAFERLWGGVIPSKPGMTTPAMVEAAQAGKLKALYVMGANPLTHFGTLGFGRGNSAVADRSRTVPDGDVEACRHRLPRCLGLRKRRHRHQHFRRNSAAAQSRRSDGPAQRLRSAAHSVAPAGKAGPRQSVSLQDAARGVRRNSQSGAGLRRAARGIAYRRRRSYAHTRCAAMATRPTTFPLGVIRSAQDTLFTSGTLGRFCTMMESLPEAEAKP